MMGAQNNNKLLRQQLHEEKRRKEEEGVLHTIVNSGARGDPKAKTFLSGGVQTFRLDLEHLHVPSSRFRGVEKQRKASERTKKPR